MEADFGFECDLMDSARDARDALTPAESPPGNTQVPRVQFRVVAT